MLVNLEDRDEALLSLMATEELILVVDHLRQQTIRPFHHCIGTLGATGSGSLVSEDTQAIGLLGNYENKQGATFPVKLPAQNKPIFNSILNIDSHLGNVLNTITILTVGSFLQYSWVLLP